MVEAAADVPRRIRRGLIEACPLGVRRASSPPVASFPGEFAGASLKQSLARDHRALLVSPVPRRIRRGLIEAASVVALVTGLVAPFPGEFAGASLKRPRDRAGELIERVVPRRIRRGLIEARPLVRGRPGLEFVPRRIRRGLIEAPSPRRPLLAHDGNRSPANSPGPH